MTKSRKTSQKQTVEAFTFGDPIPVLDQRELLGYFHAAWNGSWYEPPVSWDGLARTFVANPHHQSAINYKANLLAKHFKEHRLLSRKDFKRLALDYLVFANCYTELRKNRLGDPLAIKPLLSRWTRMKKDGAGVMLVDGQPYDIDAERLIQINDPDISQEIYGLPSYLGAMQSVLLNEAATLFRRKYYVNGSHAGFILYMTDAANNPEDVDAIRDALKKAKGPGNFRNLFMYAPGGKKDGVQVIPISEVTARDEFFNLKNVSRDDVLAAHRVPPQLLGIIPVNAGGFGSVSDAAGIFFENEITTLMPAFMEINERVGDQVVDFNLYQPLLPGK